MAAFPSIPFRATCRHFFSLYLRDVLSGILARIIETGEFRTNDVEQAANVLCALINGLLRQRASGQTDDRGVREAAAAFCSAVLLGGGSRHVGKATCP